MAASPATESPDESNGLSRRERAILARLEMDLLADVQAADRLRTGPPPAKHPRGCAFAGQVALVVIATLVGAIMFVLLPAAWLAMLALLTVQIVLPVILTMWIERHSGE